MSNKFLLLINSFLPDVNFVINSLANNTSYILYNEKDDYESILKKVKDLNTKFKSIGFMAVNDGSNILSFQDIKPIIKNVSRKDEKMKTWNKCSSFLNNLVNFTNSRNIDLVTCNILEDKDWQYIINYFKQNHNITIQSSNDITGKKGNWILESNNVSLDTTYFTSNIKKYNYSLDKVFGSSFAINNNGKLYVTGNNEDSQLGFPTNEILKAFELLNLSLNTGETIVKVSGGDNHTAVLTSNGRIFTTGRNSSGQLGFDSNRVDVSTFTLVTITGENPIDIVTGDDHTMVLTSSKKLFATGYNEDGQLGLGDYDNRNTFTEVTITELNPGETIEKVACGDDHTFVLTSNNRLFATGLNWSGQLGLNDTETRTLFTEVIINIFTYDPDTETIIPSQMTDTITQIACGNDHSFILTNTNKLFSTGANWDGQLGLGDGNDRNIFSKVTDILTYDPDTDTTNSTEMTDTITKIMCGDHYTMFLTSTNKLFGTGDNNDGELGLNNTSNQYNFTEVVIKELNDGENIINLDAGRRHTLLVTNQGRVFGTGDNGDNQLGIETDGENVIEFTLISPVTGLNNGEIIQNVICGEFQTILLTNNNRLFGAGENTDGQLGKKLYGTIYGFIEANIPLQQGENVQQVSAGRYHTFALTSNNRLFGTGANWDGHLGLGNINTNIYIGFTLIPTTFLSNNETISKIACGQNHSLILTSNNRLFGTGYTWNGQLGTGNNETIYEFTEISVTGLNSGEIITKLSCGNDFTLISTNQNRVFSTGDNWTGQLGTGDTDYRLAFTEITIPTLNTNETISQILAGTYHSFILTNNNRIFATGYNSNGQLGTGDYNIINTFTSIILPNLNEGELISQLSNGWYFTSFLTTKNRIFGTGSNWSGELGTGDNNDTNVFTPAIMPTLNPGETISQIISGGEHTLFLTSSNRIFGTGANWDGQLGIEQNSLSDNKTNEFTTVSLTSGFVPVSFGVYIFDNTPPSNICFIKDTPINTDQGIVFIQDINPKIHTIRGKPVILVTKTISDEKYLVCIKQGALGKNIPSQKTIMTMNHELFYNGSMIPAKNLLNMKLNVKKINYNGEILYNILLDEHYKMLVNNLIVETLSPTNAIAKLFMKINNTKDLNLIKKYTDEYNKKYNTCKQLGFI